MRILVETKGGLLSLLDDSPLRREELEVQPVANAGEALTRTTGGVPDLCLLPRDADSGTLDSLRRAGVPATVVADARAAATALQGVGVAMRMHERLPLHLPVRLEAVGVEMEGLTKDVSRGGAFVRCEPALEAGAPVTLRVERSGGPLSLPARVVRTVTGEGGRLAGLGLAFGDLDPAQRRGLEEQLEGPLPPTRIPRLRYRT